MVDGIDRDLERANLAREQALPACRRAIRAAGSSIRAVHRLDHAAAASLAADSEAAMREAQRVLAPFPALAQAGFLHDAEKEFVEARSVAALVAGEPVPGPRDLHVSATAGCGASPRRPASCGATCSTGCARADPTGASRCSPPWTTCTRRWW